MMYFSSKHFFFNLISNILIKSILKIKINTFVQSEEEFEEMEEEQYVDENFEIQTRKKEDVRQELKKVEATETKLQVQCNI